MIRAEIFRATPGRMRGHGHADWHLCGVLAGAFEERMGRSAELCDAGRVRVSKPRAAHDLEFSSDGADCLILEATGPFWSALFRRAQKPGAEHTFGRVRATQLDATARALVDDDPRQRVRGFFHLGGVFASRSDVEAPAWAEDAREAIAAGAGRVGLSALASELGLARADFARGFQRHYGFRPVEFRALHRVRAALTLLREGAPLAEAALDAGYAHQSHMTNSLRAILGATPAALAPNLQDADGTACMLA